jgi:hypothetical protein
VAIGASHRKITYRGELWPFYMLALTDSRVFLARHAPVLYDRNAQRVPRIELLPGTVVRIRFEEIGRVRWMSAIQIIQSADDPDWCPFDPV